MSKDSEKFVARWAAFIAVAAERGGVLAPISCYDRARWAADLLGEMSAGARYAKMIETRLCNVPMTEAAQIRARTRIQYREIDLNAKLAAAGLDDWRVTLGGDCRGLCGTLDAPDYHGVSQIGLG
jgi:hypothetical protein